MAITARRARSLVACHGADSLALVDTATNKVVAQIPGPQAATNGSPTQDATGLMSPSKKGSLGLEIVNWMIRPSEDTIPLEHPPRARNFNPDGKWLYFTLVDVDGRQGLDTDQQ